jgi:hypothetical protein
MRCEKNSKALSNSSLITNVKFACEFAFFALVLLLHADYEDEATK